VERFFAGLELEEPGVVQTCQWRPDPADSVEKCEDPQAEGGSGSWVGVARKP
jgi:hypothetical protein